MGRPARDDTELTNRQRKFINHYLLVLNARQAAVAAGYSKRTASSQATQLMSLPKIAEAIEAGMKDIATRTAVNQDKVVFELARLSFSNAQDYIDKDTGLPITDIRKLSRDAAAAITEINFTTTERDGATRTQVRYKLADKKGSLELLGKHLGMFAKEVHHTGTVQLERMTKDEADQRLIELKAKLVDS